MIATDAAEATDLLVIDDDDDLRMLMKLSFEFHGWTVATAPDGQAGLEVLHDLVEHGAEPAVLLDVKMPKIDGWEVLARIRSDERLRHLPVLLCTVGAGEDDRRRRGETNADGFIAKPFDIDDLVEQVRAVKALTAVERVARRARTPCLP